MLCLSFRGFNHSVWHALVVLAVPSAVVYALAFKSIVYKKDGYYHFFDPKHNTSAKLQAEGGEFGPHSQRYCDFAKLLIALSSGIIAFLVNTVANIKGSPSPIAAAIESTAPIVVGFFGSSIALLIFFMGLLAYWYEEYCHSWRHNTYSRWKYATIVWLGFTGVLAFVVGVVWFAGNLFSG
jgi:hypothetical protein